MSKQPKITTYTPGKLVVSIVPREQGETVMHVAKSAGARGGTIMLGHTTVENRICLLLGLDNKETEVVFTLLSYEEMPKVMDAFRHDEHMRKVRAGMAFSLEVAGILRHVFCPPEGAGIPAVPGAASSSFPNPEPEQSSMSANATHELISVIVNAGFAGDIMDAARKAGAPGGTIINARGTGREEDMKFFGISIVPEKEFIMIIVPKEKAADILEAVKQTSCLSKPGIGIAFCMDVESFMLLGKK